MEIVNFNLINLKGILPVKSETRILQIRVTKNN